METEVIMVTCSKCDEQFAAEDGHVVPNGLEIYGERLGLCRQCYVVAMAEADDYYAKYRGVGDSPYA